MVKTLLTRIQKARARLANLEARLSEEQRNELAALPAAYGYPGVGPFLRAVQKASGMRPRKRQGTVIVLRRPAKKVTPEMMDEMRKLMTAKLSALEIAKKVGVHFTTVYAYAKRLRESAAA